jgi:co-chaperonin GroES (HSP10)
MSEVAFDKPAEEIDVELPLVPVGWRVLVRPYEPKKTWGDSELVIASEALESEKLLTCVGQIVAMGDQCYSAVTRSGIELAKMDPKPKVGDWIMYGTYGGQNLVTKAGAKYLLMNDDGIMGIVKDPASFRAYL